MWRVILLVISIILIPSFAQASKTQEFRLSNGMKLIVREDDRAPVVLSSVWYKVGGSYETNGTTGISHLLEHLMFKGTKQFGKGVFNKMISDVGGKQNAMTSEDYTMYYQQLASDKLALSFKLEADRMKNLVINDSDFDKERNVVMEERRMRVEDNPQGLTWERFRAAVFVNNPYHHPVIGWMTDIKHLTIDDARNWYKTWYTPNNVVVIVVGAVKPDHVFLLAKKYFGAQKSSHLPKLKPRTEVRSLGERDVQVHVNARLPWLVMGYNVPTLVTVSPKEKTSIYALKVAEFILSGGDSARFSKDIIRKKQTAVAASAGYDIYDLHQGVFVLSGVPAPKHTVLDLKTAFIKEINRLKQTLVTKMELDRVKAQLIARTVYRKDSLIQQAYFLGVPEMVGLSWRDSDTFVSKIKSVTPIQVRDAVKKYLITSHLTVGQLRPLVVTPKKKLKKQVEKTR